MNEMIEILVNMCELEGVAKVDTIMDCFLSHCPHRRQLSTELPRCSQYWMSTKMVRERGRFDSVLLNHFPGELNEDEFVAGCLRCVWCGRVWCIVWYGVVSQ